MGAERPAAPADLPLRLNTYPARTGLQWVRQGLRLFAGAPLVLVVLVGLGPLLLSTLQVLVPLLGEFLAYWLAPAAAVGVLNVCRDVRAGGAPGVGSYLRVLHDPLARLRLLQLGIYYALFAGLFSLLVNLLAPAAPGAVAAPPAGAAAPGLTSPVAPAARGVDAAATNATNAAPAAPAAPSPLASGTDAPALPPAGPPDAATAGAGASPAVAPSASTATPPGPGSTDAGTPGAGPAASPVPVPAPLPSRSAPSAVDAPLPKLSPLALALLGMIGIPFAMTIWFAPPLVGWYRMPVAKALFFSFFACWRNRGALLIYLVTLLGLGALGLLLLGALIDLINAREGLAPFLLMAPLVFLMLAIFQSAHLMMVEAVIEPGAPAPATDPQNWHR